MTIALESPKQKTLSAQIRERLGYPIIDTDVHTQEFEPAFLDYLAAVGGAKYRISQVRSELTTALMRGYLDH